MKNILTLAAVTLCLAFAACASHGTCPMSKKSSSCCADSSCDMSKKPAKKK